MAMSRGAFFVDKDGTLVEDVPYNIDPSLVVFRPGAIEALREIQLWGLSIVLVSNQSAVARGLCGVPEVRALFQSIERRLGDAGVEVTESLFCPHHPEGVIAEYSRACDCRKPADGLLREAAARHDICLERSYMAGDILDDVEAGNRAGCTTFLLSPGGETEWHGGDFRRPDFVAKDLLEVAEIILGLGMEMPVSDLTEAHR